MSTELASIPDWESLILAWEKSCIPQKTYCQQKDLSYNRFVYERGLLMKRRRLSSGHFLAVKKSTECAMPEASSAISPPSTGFVLRCPNGYQLAIPLQADAQTLNQLLRFLEAAVC